MKIIAVILVLVCGAAYASQEECVPYNDWLAGIGLGGVVELEDARTTPAATVGVLRLAASAPPASTRALWQSLRDGAGATFELRLLHRFAQANAVPVTSVILRIINRTGCWERTLSLAAAGLEQDEQHHCSSTFREVTTSFRGPPLEELAWLADGCSVSAFGAFEGSPEALLDACEHYLRNRYARGRVVQIHRPLPDILLLATDGFKDEVLRGRNRWEKLEAVLVTSDANKLVLTLDAWFAPGVGSRPPPIQSYRDLEHAYAGELDYYTGDLLTQLLRLGREE